MSPFGKNRHVNSSGFLLNSNAPEVSNMEEPKQAAHAKEIGCIPNRCLGFLSARDESRAVEIRRGNRDASNLRARLHARLESEPENCEIRGRLGRNSAKCFVGLALFVEL